MNYIIKIIRNLLLGETVKIVDMHDKEIVSMIARCESYDKIIARQSGRLQLHEDQIKSLQLQLLQLEIRLQNNKKRKTK